MQMTPEQILATLCEWLGPRTVLLPMPLGTKHPDWKGWEQTTFEETQTPGYQAWLYQAIARGGNVGVRLTDGLVSIDIDSDDQVHGYLSLNPKFTATLQSRGRRGRNIWLRIVGDYPTQVHFLKTNDGKKWGEWRGGGQTVIFGQHKDSTPANPIRYCCIVRAAAMQGLFNGIVWPAELPLPWLKNNPEVQPVATQAGLGPDLRNRILAYIAKIPVAVQGNGGDQRTFTVACELVNGWNLTASDAMQYLRLYSDKCEPPWSDKDLLHKLEEAERRHTRSRAVTSSAPPTFLRNQIGQQKSHALTSRTTNRASLTILSIQNTILAPRSALNPMMTLRRSP
jgi:hypothetical protein